MIYDIYLLTAIGLSPGGSTHLHTNNKQNNTKQTIHRTTQQFWKNTTILEEYNNFGRIRQFWKNNGRFIRY